MRQLCSRGAPAASKHVDHRLPLLDRSTASERQGERCGRRSEPPPSRGAAIRGLCVLAGATSALQGRCSAPATPACAPVGRAGRRNRDRRGARRGHRVVARWSAAPLPLAGAPRSGPPGRHGVLRSHRRCQAAMRSGVQGLFRSHSTVAISASTPGGSGVGRRAGDGAGAGGRLRPGGAPAATSSDAVSRYSAGSPRQRPLDATLQLTLDTPIVLCQRPSDGWRVPHGSRPGGPHSG